MRQVSWLAKTVLSPGHYTGGGRLSLSSETPASYSAEDCVAYHFWRLAGKGVESYPEKVKGSGRAERQRVLHWLVVFGKAGSEQLLFSAPSKETFS